MAKQDSIITLRGTIGKITFLKRKGVHLAQTKGGIDAGSIATDPAFIRTRENGAEFGRAAKAGKLMRTCLRALLVNVGDSSKANRLSSAFNKVIKADAVNPRGLRNVIDGEAELLEGFDFNVNGKLGTTMYAPFNSSIDRVTGVLEVAIDAFVPINMLNAPQGTTHFKIRSAGAAIDFEDETYEIDVNETAELPWTNAMTAAITLSNSVTANNSHPLFLLLGIEFYQQVNGTMYPLKSGIFNPLNIVMVNGV